MVTKKPTTTKNPAIPKDVAASVRKRFTTVNKNIGDAALSIKSVTNEIDRKFKELEKAAKDGFEKERRDTSKAIDDVLRGLAPGGTMAREIGEFTKEHKSSFRDINANLTVLPIPPAITKLSRWLDFWEGSASKFYKKLKENSLKLKGAADDISEGGYRNSAFRGPDGGYVPKDMMNDFMQAVYRAAQGSTDPQSVVDSALASLPLASRKEMEVTMGSLLNTLRTLLNTDRDLYELTENEKQTSGVSGVDQLSKAATLTRSLKEVAKNFETEISDRTQSDATVESRLSTLLSQAKDRGYTKVELKTSVTGPDGNSKIISTVFDISRKITAKKLDTLKSAISSNTGTISLLNKEDMEFQALSNELLEKDRQLRSQKDIGSQRKSLEEFLKSVVVESNSGGMKQELFSEKDIKMLSSLFTASFAALPKFAVEGNKEIGLDVQSGAASIESLGVARMHLARIMEKLIADKVLNNIGGNKIVMNQAYYDRSRKKEMVFDGDAEGLINQILYAITPTGFPRDWTVTFALRQQVKLVVGGEELTAASQSQTIDPNLKMSEIAKAQGDHVIAYNKGLSAVPRNLLALSAELNSSLKKDSDSGLDQILMTAQVYEDFFGMSSELEWIKASEDTRSVLSVQAEASKIDTKAIEARFAKIKDPEEEIRRYHVDVDKLPAIEAKMKYALQRYHEVYDRYIKVFQHINAEFSLLITKGRSIHSEINRKANLADIATGHLKGNKGTPEQSLKNALSTLNDLLVLAEFLKDAKLKEDTIKKLEASKKDIQDMLSVISDIDGRNNRALYAFRTRLDSIRDSYEAEMDDKRRSALLALSELMATVNVYYASITEDLMKGTQAYRGSRIIAKEQVSPNRTAAKLPKPIIKASTASVNPNETYLHQNKKVYGEMVDKWNAAESEFKTMMGDGRSSTRPNFKRVLNEAQGLQKAMELLVESNRFLLFSEYFD